MSSTGVESRAEIGSIWRSLQKRAAKAWRELDVYETRVTLDTGSVLLGLDSQGNRHVLVPVASDSTVQPDRRSGGVHILTRVASVDGRDRRFMDIVCIKPHLEEVFSIFAGELLKELATASGDPLTTRTHRVLEDWRELFGRDRGGQLGRSALAGLYGELWHLLQICTRAPGALQFWKGPSGDRIDIRTAGCALEVKTTLRQYGRVVEVHGQRQLQVPEGSDLYLAFMKLEEVEIGDSVPDLVERVRDTGADRAELLKRLSEAGYDPSEEKRYREYRFEIVEDLIFQVDDQFPRIVPESFTGGNVPEGVLSISYSLDLTGSDFASIDTSDRASVYDRIAAGDSA